MVENMSGQLVQPTIERVAGFRVAGVHCGIKADSQLDFALIVSEQPCVTAGVFTKNEIKAASVLLNAERINHNPDGIRAVAVNSGNANACTGRKGLQDAQVTATWTAEQVDCRPEDVLVMSTGVIGVHLPMDKMRDGVNLAASALGDDWHAAASAIMTTDVYPKLAEVTVDLGGGQSVQIAGIAKGAGMIAPDMATMLSVIVTDAALTVEQAQAALRSAADVSYNRIVVDGDSSTNDTVLLLANGASQVAISSPEQMATFQAALDAVSMKLAQEIVRNGEGVTKFITVQVHGAASDEDAHRIANTIATSPLVKTAFAGEDANWGRIVAAAGRASARLDADRVALWFSPGSGDSDYRLQLVAGGERTDYQEDDAAAIMREADITVTLDCGVGVGSAVVWTCDLSHEYVSINADYRS